MLKDDFCRLTESRFHLRSPVDPNFSRFCRKFVNEGMMIVSDLMILGALVWIGGIFMSIVNVRGVDRGDKRSGPLTLTNTSDFNIYDINGSHFHQSRAVSDVGGGIGSSGGWGGGGGGGGGGWMSKLAPFAQVVTRPNPTIDLTVDFSLDSIEHFSQGGSLGFADSLQNRRIWTMLVDDISDDDTVHVGPDFQLGGGGESGGPLHRRIRDLPFDGGFDVRDEVLGQNIPGTPVCVSQYGGSTPQCLEYDEIEISGDRTEQGERHGFCCVEGQKWLNGDVFNTWFRTLSNVEGWGWAEVPAVMGSSVWVADTLCLRNWVAKAGPGAASHSNSHSGISGVNSQWSKKVRENKITQQEVDDLVSRARATRYALIPINTGVHWYYCCVDFTDRKIDVVNSYGVGDDNRLDPTSFRETVSSTFRGDVVQRVSYWAQLIQSCRGETRCPFSVHVRTCKTQPDFTECGFHTVGSMLSRGFGLKYNGISVELAEFMRRWTGILLWMSGVQKISLTQSKFDSCPTFLKRLIDREMSGQESMVTCVPSDQVRKLSEIVQYVVGCLRNRVVETHDVKCDVSVVQLPDVGQSMSLYEVMTMGRQKEDTTSAGGDLINLVSPTKTLTSDVPSSTKVSCH